MKWYKNLYVGESAQKKKKKIIKSIEKNEFYPGTYILSLPQNKSNVLDMFPCMFLMQKSINKENIKIIGIALSKEEAYEVLQEIIMDTYEATKSVRVDEFLVDFK